MSWTVLLPFIFSCFDLHECTSPKQRQQRITQVSPVITRVYPDRENFVHSGMATKIPPTGVELKSENYLARQSSCYYLDIRNSTSIIRSITFGGQGIHQDRTRLVIHAQLMMRIHEFLFEKLGKLQLEEFYFDNTGDGHLCLLWNKTHAWSLLDIVCSLSHFIEKELKEYQQNYLAQWSVAIDKPLTIGFGIGIHSAGSLIYHHEKIGRQFGYGTVLNSAARVESFTKNFSNLQVVFTGNFKGFLSRQFKLLGEKRQQQLKDYTKKINAVTNYPGDVKDSRGKGHLLFTINKKDRAYFMSP